MKNFFKKNWFVCVVAVLFIAIAVYFIYDQNKDVLWGKTKGGSGVVFSLDGTDYTADDLYEKYFANGGSDASYTLMQRTLLDKAVKTTDDMKTDAASMAEQYQSYFEQYYGDSATSLITQNLTAIGLDSLDEYCLYNLKLEELSRQYVEANTDKYWTDFAAEYSPRMVSHVLIQMSDPDNPTEDEAAALKEAQEAWASGEYTFEEFAKKYSDDSSTAVNGGVIGYIDKDSTDTYVEILVTTALSLKEGEVSEWVKSDYGYHLITVTSTQAKDCIEDTSCIEQLLTYWPNLEKQAMWAKMQELGTTFSDETVEKDVKDALEVQDDGTIPDGRTTEGE